MVEVSRPIHGYSFGRFELDSETGELRNNGSPVDLQPQPLQLLTILLQNQGKLVTREQIQKQLWTTETFVEFEVGLNQAIKKLRDALGDSANKPIYIETVPRKGYRFIAPVGVIEPRRALSGDPLIGRPLGHYILIEHIGQGGMGVVYRAHDDHLKRDVAVKVLPQGSLADETSRRRFRREALALSKLNHPNVATIYDFDSQDGVDFLVQELIPGTSLEQMLISGPITEKQIAALGIQLCEGLAAAHQQALVHRDLKPANLRITAEGRLKILDFGIALALQPPTKKSEDLTVSRAETKHIRGTLPYMAPEQLLNEEIDTRTDIWATGCVLYEMACGRLPFARDGVALADSILHQCPTPPSQLNRKISAGMDAIILKCLEKDAALRYASAQDLAVDLRRLSSGVTSDTKNQKIFGKKSRFWKNKYLLAVAALATLAIVFGLLFLANLISQLSGTRPITSLAILPVKNLSGDPAQNFFAESMTDGLIAEFGQIKKLRVISRTSAMHYKETNKTAPEIARELGVDGIVEASVSRSAGHIQLIAALVDGPKDRQLWAARYDRDVADVLALQSEIVQQVAVEIHVRLTPEEGARLRTTRQVNEKVYDFTAKGRAILVYATREEHLREAIKLFQLALDRDPTYAPAWAGLAEATWTLAMTGFEYVAPAEVRERSIAAAERALALDETLADAHKARAIIALDGEFDLEGAKRHFERALELQPGDAAAHNLYGQMLGAIFDFQKAQQHYQKAALLDPLSPWNDINVIGYWIYQGQPAKALQIAESASRRNPTLWVIRWEMGHCRILMGQPEKAIDELNSALELLSPDRPAAVLAPLGMAYGLSGRQSDALQILAEIQQPSKSGYVSPFYMAMVYSGLGRMDEAFHLLDQAIAQRTPYLVSATRRDASSVALRRDPRWKDFLMRLRPLVHLPPGTPDPYGS